ncbi:MAG: sigma-70 family RNA polymerase sigma factor [Ruminococcus sp.]|nr:sigma-70 family RNA polymerase sigma factor [Ruminococcus sp.]
MSVAIQNDDDREFIAELYRSKYRIWFKEAYKLTQDRHAAEDIINDVFVKLFSKIDVLREIGCYKSTGYIVKSIRNTCKRYLKNKAKGGYPVDFYNDDNMANIPDSFNTEKTVFYRLDREVFAKVFNTLPDFEQDFIIKSFFENLSDREIAAQTGMKYNNIRTYRCRLVNKLKKLCSKESEVKKHG